MTSRYEELVLPEQRDRIVEKVVAALKSDGQLPGKTLSAFRDLFKAGKPIPGFNNDPLRAMPPLLKRELLERLEQTPEIEPLIVGVWTDAEPELRDIVGGHLDALEQEVFLTDDIDEEFWDVQVSSLADRHAEYEEDDILLMTKICLARTKSQAGSEGGADDEVEREPLPMEGDLGNVLESLRDMPASSPQWRDSIPRFVEAVEELIKEKNQELVHVNGITTDLIHIQSVFQSELSFFREEDEEWDTPALATLLADSQGVDEASQSLSRLKEELTTYRQIKERADNIAEERERRGLRQDLEEAIEGTLREIDEASRAAVKAVEPESSGLATHPGETNAHTKSSPGENAELIEELQALKREQESATSESLVLQREVEGLQADKQALADEVTELRDQLRISETNATNWRNAYDAGMSTEDMAAPEPIPAEIASVREAWDLAKARLGHRLAFRPNKKSEIDYNYKRPKEVWDALEWLATTYHDVRTGKTRVIDLNESIKNTCSGWEYRPNQTDITLNTFREWYETTKDGKTFELREHLAKGTGRDANVIRIAFAWDEDSERAIVGYIGPHQRSRSS